MKSTNAELEKKIDEILNDMDFSEISKEPLSKSFDSFLRYAKENFFDQEEPEGVTKESLINFLNEFKKSKFKYDRGMHYRIHEWEKTAEEKFSKMLNEEVGMAREDISIIKKPFHLLQMRMGMLQDFFDVFNEFNFDFLIKYKDAKLSVNKFFSRLRNNKCPELSALYDSSIESFIRIMELEVVVASDELINKRFLEEIFIPFRKKEEEYVDEEEMRREFGSIAELDEDLCGINISSGKRVLARNILDIDSIYSTIRRKYSSLSEYIENDLGLGAKPFMF